MTARETCFVDVDGVLADLHGALADLFGRDVRDWPRGEDDVGRALQAMPIVRPDAEADLVVRELGRAVTRGRRAALVWSHTVVGAERFWASLPVLPWKAGLLDRLDRRFGADRVVLLTCPIRTPRCVAGKAEWIACHCPGRGHLIGRPKSACAAPGRYLVDDQPKEIAAWTAAGGGAPLLLPRPWNGQAGEPLDAVDGWLEGLDATARARAGASA